MPVAGQALRYAITAGRAEADFADTGRVDTDFMGHLLLQESKLTRAQESEAARARRAAILEVDRRPDCGTACENAAGQTLCA